MMEFKDEFLSEEDLDLVNCSNEELEILWNTWLKQAQITNKDDENSYSHGVFMTMDKTGVRPTTNLQDPIY